MEVFRVTFNWVDPQGEPQDLDFACQGSKVMAEMRNALQTEVQPTFGESCTIHIDHVATFRDTAGV
jgi:hypothetical protein